MKEYYVEVVLLQNPDEMPWSREENNRMFWLVNKAFQFLSDYSLFIHYPLYRGDLSNANRLSWIEAHGAVGRLYRRPEYKTIFVCLRAESWWREGMAHVIGGDYIVVSYRDQMGFDGSPWWQMVAHEILHLFGATDEYGDGSVSQACIMADLAQTRICDKTLRQVYIGGNL